MVKPTHATIMRVNREVNGNTRYRRDIDLYDQPEFWEVANGEGDCEDYALAKHQLLIE